MKTIFKDKQNRAYEFELNNNGLVSNVDGKIMVMPLEQVLRNSKPWNFCKNEYLKMSDEAISYIENFCKNI